MLTDIAHPNNAKWWYYWNIVQPYLQGPDPKYIGIDLFMFNSKNYIATVDYYSNFIEMDSLNDTTS